MKVNLLDKKSLTISEVLKQNRFAGFKIISGHIILEFVFISIILLGFQKFLSHNNFLLAVSIIGGSALIIMGAILLLTASKMKLSSIKTNSGFNKGLVIGGIFFSIISPGFLVWWATIGVSTVMRALSFGILGVIILTLGHWSADVFWYGFLSFAVDKGKAYLNDKSYQNVMKFFSVLLIILGLFFLIK